MLIRGWCPKSALIAFLALARLCVLVVLFWATWVKAGWLTALAVSVYVTESKLMAVGGKVVIPDGRGHIQAPLSSLHGFHILNPKEFRSEGNVKIHGFFWSQDPPIFRLLRTTPTHQFHIVRSFGQIAFACENPGVCVNRGLYSGHCSSDVGDGNGAEFLYNGSSQELRCQGGSLDLTDNQPSALALDEGFSTSFSGLRTGLSRVRGYLADLNKTTVFAQRDSENDSLRSERKELKGADNRQVSSEGGQLAGVFGKFPVYFQFLVCLGVGGCLFGRGFYLVLYGGRVFVGGLPAFAGFFFACGAFSALLDGKWWTFWRNLG